MQMVAADLGLADASRRLTICHATLAGHDSSKKLLELRPEQTLQEASTHAVSMQGCLVRSVYILVQLSFVLDCNCSVTLHGVLVSIE